MILCSEWVPSEWDKKNNDNLKVIRLQSNVDLFLTNMQLFTSQDNNWWTGVVWISCGLLWCLDWRHPFTTEDPLVNKRIKAKFLQTSSDEETNSSTSWIAWGGVHFQQIFERIIPLNRHFKSLIFPKCNTSLGHVAKMNIINETPYYTT